MKRLTKLLALGLVLSLVLGLAPAAALAEAGHTHSWREVSRTEPTCTQAGSVTSVCSCGERKVESIPALGHAWNEGEILPDEHFPGGKKLHFWCWRCGATKDEPLPADAEDDYGWEPPEEQEEPEELDDSEGSDEPGWEVSPASGEEGDWYAWTREFDQDTDRIYRYGDHVEGKVTFTNIGLYPLDIWVDVSKSDYITTLSYVFYYLEFVSFDKANLQKGAWWGGEFEPGESATLVYSYDVIDEDLENYEGWFHRAFVYHIYPGGTHDSSGQRIADNPQTWDEYSMKRDGYVFAGRTVLDGSPSCYLAEPVLELKADVSGTYAPGEYAEICLDALNTGGEILKDWEVDVYRWDTEANDYVFMETMEKRIHKFTPPEYDPASCADSRKYQYKVTEEDVANAVDGTVWLAFKARSWTLPRGGHILEDVESELVPVNIDTHLIDLKLDAEDTSAGQVPEDDWVKVKLTVTNQGTAVMRFTGKSNVACCDTNGVALWGCDDYELHIDDSEAFNWFEPGSTLELEFWTHPDETDMMQGDVVRRVELEFARLEQADGKAVLPDTPKEEVVGATGHYYTNEVIIYVPLLEPPEPAPAPEPDACTPALTGLGDGAAEWSLTRCPDHAAVAREAEDKTPEEALALWSEALEAEYDEWFAEADESLRPLIEAERAAFEAQLAAYGAAWLRFGDEEIAAGKAMDLVMHKVSLLCFAREAESEDWAALFAGTEYLGAADQELLSCRRESHDFGVSLQAWETLCADHRQIPIAAENAEGWRELKTLWLAALNAGTDERWLAADEESRALIAAERQSFGKWLAAWETLLTARYPEDPALVQELLTQAVQGRTIDFCR